MSHLLITSAYAPAPSYFRKQRRQRSFSSNTSAASLVADADATSDDTLSEEDSSDESATTLASDDDELERATSFAAAASSLGALHQRSSSHINGDESATLTRTAPLNISSSSSRTELRLSLAVTRARHALKRHEYETLATTLGSIKAALPSDLSTLGVFVPVLHRFSRTLKEELSGKDKQFRKTLTKTDAKALISLQQRWCTASDSDGHRPSKAADDHGWVQNLRELVGQHAQPPSCVPNVPTPAESALLDGLERLLLPSTLPRLSLSDQGVTDEQLEQLSVLQSADQVLDWYLSFAPPPQSHSGSEILAAVNSLDLSKNAFSRLPAFLPKLFPNLETLNLSNNAFKHLPPAIMLFSCLKRIKTRGNKLAKHGKVPRLRSLHATDDPTRSNTREVVDTIKTRLPALLAAQKEALPIPSLFSIALDVVRSHQIDPAGLPELFSTAIATSYACCSCHQAVNEISTPLLHLPPLFERVHHLDPGVIVPPQSGDASATHRASISVDERVMLALYGRNTTIETFVIDSPIPCEAVFGPGFWLDKAPGETGHRRTKDMIGLLPSPLLFDTAGDLKIEGETAVNPTGCPELLNLCHFALNGTEIDGHESVWTFSHKLEHVILHMSRTKTAALAGVPLWHLKISAIPGGIYVIFAFSDTSSGLPADLPASLSKRCHEFMITEDSGAPHDRFKTDSDGRHSSLHGVSKDEETSIFRLVHDLRIRCSVDGLLQIGVLQLQLSHAHDEEWNEVDGFYVNAQGPNKAIQRDFVENFAVLRFCLPFVPSKGSPFSVQEKGSLLHYYLSSKVEGTNVKFGFHVSKKGFENLRAFTQFTVESGAPFDKYKLVKFSSVIEAGVSTRAHHEDVFNPMRSQLPLVDGLIEALLSLNDINGLVEAETMNVEDHDGLITVKGANKVMCREVLDGRPVLQYRVPMQLHPKALFWNRVDQNGRVDYQIAKFTFVALVEREEGGFKTKMSQWTVRTNPRSVFAPLDKRIIHLVFADVDGV
ncbi:hypothetical protein ACM66B_002788 [Microbotryomycetes sp. NB124-2]